MCYVCILFKIVSVVYKAVAMEVRHNCTKFNYDITVDLQKHLAPTLQYLEILADLQFIAY